MRQVVESAGGSKTTRKAGAIVEAIAGAHRRDASPRHLPKPAPGAPAPGRRSAGKRSGRSLSSLLVAGASALALLASLSPSLAQSVTIGGDVDPSPAQSPNWNVGGTLDVGRTGIGTLDVAAGGTLANTAGSIGTLAGSNGTATVTGSDTTWTNSGTLAVGNGGSGTLTVAASGTLANTDGSIGTLAGSTGTATVAGAGSSWTNGGTLEVGGAGAGTLNVATGGTLANTDGIIANAVGSTGMATVSGTGSTWTNGGTLAVGNGGSGALDVVVGGTLVNTDGSIGGSTGSTGTATVAGTGSAWTNSGTLAVGDGGTGTLIVATGGTLENTDASIGNATDSTGTATVTGAGSIWTNSGTLSVGNGGSGTLNVVASGTLANTNASIGNATGSTGTASVAGSGSTWTNSGTLMVGDGGTGTLNVVASGTVENTAGSIGLSIGSNGTATVTGSGSIWTNDGSLAVGDGGTGALNVLAGGTVTNTTGTIGGSTGSGGTATVMGSGSNWTTGGTLAVGDGGTGTLNVLAGGAVTNIDGTLGRSTGSNGAANVTGTGSTWTNTGTLEVGRAGAGTLTISGGGLVTADGVAVASQAGSTGIVNIGAAAGSTAVSAGTLSTSSLALGADGALVFNHSGNVDGSALAFAPRMTGSGTISQLAGTTVLTGTNGTGSQFTGTANIDGGTLAVNGVFGDTVGNTTTIAVRSGGTLAGSGTIAGMVTIASGGTLAPGTLTLGGDLALNAGSSAVFELGAPGVVGGADNDLVTVGGNLAVDGTLNLQTIGGAAVASGYYTLFDVSGTTTGTFASVNNGGAAAAGATQVVTNGGASASEFNVLLANGGQILQFWDGAGGSADGAVDGGTGTWDGATTNWTTVDGAIDDRWRSSVGIFGGAAGIVTVAGTRSFEALQFRTTGTTLTGGGLTALADAGLGSTSASITTDADVTATIASAIGGTAGLTKFGSGTLVLSGSNTYSGVTTIAAGTLELLGGVAIADGDIAADGAAGSVVVSNGARLAVSNAETIGSLSGDRASSVTLGATLTTGDAGSDTFAGTISGAGGLVKQGAGTLVLSGTNTYTGGTTISAGTLQIGAGGTAGSITGDVVNNAALVFDHSDDVTFAGTISGSGTVLATGAGRLDLTGDLAGFTGTTTVAGATAVNGTIGGSVDVASGGRLSGAGTIRGNVALASGGTVAPGNSPGTLAIDGDFIFADGSTYEVETVPGSGVSDRLAVGGTATLNGGEVRHVGQAGGYQPTQTYTILTAEGGVTGRFADVTSTYVFLTPLLGYSANAVTLTLNRNATTLASVGETQNQRAAAAGLDGLGFSNAAFSAVTLLDAPNARTAFDQLSGEIHASEKTGRLEDSRFVRNTASDRLNAAFGEPSVGSSTSGPSEGALLLGSTGLSAWISGYGSWGKTESDGNAASLDRDTGGFLVGADGLITETLRVGLLAGYGEASFDTAGRGSADVDTTSLGLYAGAEIHGFDLKAGAAYGFSRIDTTRSIAFGTFRDDLTADYDGGTAQVFGEAAYRFAVAPTATLTPFANLAYVSLNTDGFTERGGAAALSSGDDTADATFSTLGLRGAATLPLGDLALTANAMLGWRHAFGDRAPGETLAFAGGPAFAVSGSPIDADAAVVEFGLGIDVAPNATLGLHYAGQFGDGASDDGVRASLDVTF